MKGKEGDRLVALLAMPSTVDCWASDIAIDDIKIPCTAAAALVSRMMSCAFPVPARIIESADDATGKDRLE
jgi:hypothetical protein